jgi:hypothetical protein
MDILANALGGSCDLALNVSSSNGTPLSSNTITLDNSSVSQPLILPNQCQGCFVSLQAKGCTVNATFAFGGLAFSSPGNMSAPCESQITASSNWTNTTGQKQKHTGTCPPFIPRTTSSNDTSIQVKFNGSGVAVVGNYQYSNDHPSSYIIVRGPNCNLNLISPIG